MDNKTTINNNNTTISNHNSDLNSILNTINSLPTVSGSFSVSANGTYNVKNYAEVVVNVESSTSTEDISSELNTYKNLLATQDTSITNINTALANKGESAVSQWRGVLTNSTTSFVDTEMTVIRSYGFSYASALETVSIPNLTKTNTYAFRGCSGLQEANFPLLTSLGAGTFYGCTALVTAYLPKATKLDSNMFYGCKALQNVTATAAVSTGEHTFRECIALKTIDLPSMTSIAANSFYGCTGIEKLILRSTTAATLSNVSAFTGSSIESGTGYIYVPDNLVDTYKAATNWSIFANQIKRLSELEG